MSDEYEYVELGIGALGQNLRMWTQKGWHPHLMSPSANGLTMHVVFRRKLPSPPSQEGTSNG
jgi:hypothetical protein